MRNLGTVRLVAMAGVAVSIVLFFVFLSAKLNTADMALLYGDIDPGDSAKIVAKLETMQIPFELRAGGRQIYVPSDRTLRLRMSLAQEGLPNGGTMGYEIFDRGDSFGTTNFVQNVNLVRALEGELARTIRALGPVSEARVHLVLPKRQLFSKKQQDPTASIVVKTTGPSKLEKIQVLSIQHLVASAVPGLNIDKISVIDHRGRLLARAGSEDDSGLLDASNNDEIQRAQEARMVRRIEELLEQSVGIGKIRAQLTVEMNFDRITTNSIRFDPDGQVVRSTQNVEETAKSADQKNGGGVSVANNLPDAQDTQGADGSSSRSNRNEETVNYEISKTVRTQVREIGTIRRLSIAILVDGTYTVDEDDKRTYQPRTKASLANLEALAKSAVGFDAKRGDTLKVINMQFVTQVDDNFNTIEPLFGLNKADYFRIAEIFVLAAVGILVILLVVRPLVSRTLEALPNALATVGNRNLLADQSADAPALSGPSETGVAARMAEVEEDDLIDVAAVEGKVRASALKKIEEIVERHPEETIGIVRQWMSED
jgi:flagellar M-ring protein FliF